MPSLSLDSLRSKNVTVLMTSIYKALNVQIRPMWISTNMDLLPVYNLNCGSCNPMDLTLQHSHAKQSGNHIVKYNQGNKVAMALALGLSLEFGQINLRWKIHICIVPH